MPSRGGCGRHRSEVGLISWRGLCETCGHVKVNENVDGIHFRTGPAYERWLLGIAERAVTELGALQALVDDRGESA